MVSLVEPLERHLIVATCSCYVFVAGGPESTITLTVFPRITITSVLPTTSTSFFILYPLSFILPLPPVASRLVPIDRIKNLSSSDPGGFTKTKECSMKEYIGVDLGKRKDVVVHS